MTDATFTQVLLKISRLHARIHTLKHEHPHLKARRVNQTTHKRPNEGKETPVASLALPVSTLCKQSPVVDVPEIWVLFFPLLSCVCVCAYPCWNSPWLNPAFLHLHFLRSPSLASSLAPALRKDWWAAWLPFILPDFLTEQEEGGSGRMRKVESVYHHSFLFTLGVWKKQKEEEKKKLPMCWQWQIEQ